MRIKGRFSLATNSKLLKLLEMIVYRDIISEDEVLSDAFKLSPVVDKDGATVRTYFYSPVRAAFFHLY